jgi:hypothetical protein
VVHPASAPSAHRPTATVPHSQNWLISAAHDLWLLTHATRSINDVNCLLSRASSAAASGTRLVGRGPQLMALPTAACSGWCATAEPPKAAASMQPDDLNPELTPPDRHHLEVFPI